MPRNSKFIKQNAFRWDLTANVDPVYKDLQHLGNVELSRLFTDAREAFNRHLIAIMAGPECFSEQVIVHITMDFLKEIRWIPQALVAVRTGRVGNTSYDLELVIFDDEVLASRCLTTSVWMRDRKPAALSEEARELLHSFS